MIIFGHQSWFFSGPNEPSGRLVSHRPVHPASRLADQPLVLEQVRQRNQPVEKVRPALPTFARASAVRADVGPEFIEMAAQPVRLDAELAREPATRPDRTEQQRIEVIRGQWGSVLYGLPGSCFETE